MKYHTDACIVCQIANGDPQFCTTGEIVLRGGRDRSEGRVDVCINDRWGTVCAFHVTWGEQEMDVVCQQLGFSTLQGNNGLSCTQCFTCKFVL